jgi:hypothetical protein
MSRPALRTIVAILGGLFTAGALTLAVLHCFAPAAVLAVWALILQIGLAVEHWRYQPLASRPPGPDWQCTAERFLDPETGKLVTVYFHPATGERRYIAA